MRWKANIITQPGHTIEAARPIKWVFYGDSITHGRYTRSVSGITQCSFAERIRFELGRTMDVVITTAISGDNTRGPLAGFDWRVAQFDPDVVFVMIGMNDCSEGNDILSRGIREQPHAANRKDG